MFTKLDRGEVIMALHMLIGFLGRSAQRWNQGGAKMDQWGAPFPKDFGMQQQQTECILVSWIEISWLFAVRTYFTNLTVMLSDLLRNLTFNRSAHCTQVSDQCPLGLLFYLVTLTLKFDHFNLGYNFQTISDKAFMLHMCILCDKTFKLVHVP